MCTYLCCTHRRMCWYGSCDVTASLCKNAAFYALFNSQIQSKYKLTEFKKNCIRLIDANRFITASHKLVVK